MPLTTTYIVVPFIAGLGGGLHPGTPRRRLTRGSAIAAADSISSLYTGVVVLRDRADAAADVFLEPLLVCVIGTVPGDLLEQLAA